MAVCTINRDILRTSSCGYSLPSVSTLYIIDYENVSATTVSSDTANCESLASITLVSDARFYKIVPAKDSTSFSDTLVVEDSGAKYRTHSISFSLANKYDSCLHTDFDGLSLGRFFVVVETADGSYLALGRTVGLEAESATLEGGQDNNGITVTLSANCTESALPLSDAAIATVKGN